jgi:biopolymer transport protein ExbD
MHRRPFTEPSDELDLVPLIDVVFLILLFFILCGRLSIQERPEQITVPPTRTARVPTQVDRVVMNITSGEHPLISLGAGGTWLDPVDPHNWPTVREHLDRAWDRASKRERDGRTVADVVIEIRADAEASYRLVQQAQQVVSDSVDPDAFLPRAAPRKPFLHIDLAGRTPG